MADLQQRTVAMHGAFGTSSGALATGLPDSEGGGPREPRVEDPPPSEKPIFGRVLGGKYRVQSYLGGGAMGAVYRAKQLGLDRVVAVKIMHGSLAQNPDFAARFHREAKAASLLAHPASIAVIDFGEEDDGLLYIVMELVEGRTLEEVIVEAAPLRAERIVGLLDQILAALVVAHDRGIVHRDLKPENVLVFRRGDGDEADDAGEGAKVCDFGIASLRAGARPSVLPSEPGVVATDVCRTQVGTILGSPAYMAPEQASGEAADARSDVYAIGVVLYRMLTGRHPFAGVTDMLEAHKTSLPPPARAENPSCDAALAEIALRAMQKDPDARYPTARAMRSALRRARGGEVGPTIPPVVSTNDPKKTVLGIGAVRLPFHPQRTLFMKWPALPPLTELGPRPRPVLPAAPATRRMPAFVTAPRRRPRLVDVRSLLHGIFAFVTLTLLGLTVLFLAYDELGW